MSTLAQHDTLYQARPTQEDKILDLLRSSYPNWVSAPELASISLQYNARIFALRRRGWTILNKVKTVNGVKHGSFRLAPEAAGLLFPMAETHKDLG
jgi:hypothetical protein